MSALSSCIGITDYLLLDPLVQLWRENFWRAIARIPRILECLLTQANDDVFAASPAIKFHRLAIATSKFWKRIWPCKNSGRIDLGNRELMTPKQKKRTIANHRLLHHKLDNYREISLWMVLAIAPHLTFFGHRAVGQWSAALSDYSLVRENVHSPP